MQMPDIYFEECWGKLNAKRDGGTFQTFIHEDGDGIVLQRFVKRPALLMDGVFDILSPAGFNGPVILACEEGRKEALVAAFDARFQEYCEDHRIVAEYMRFSPWIGNHADFQSIYDLRLRAVTIGIDISGDFMNEEFWKTRRSSIRKAESAGMEVRLDFEGAMIDEFYRLYQRSFEKHAAEGSDSTDPYDECYIRDLFEQCRGHVIIAGACLGGRTAAAAIFLYSDWYVHGFLIGTDPDCYEHNPHSLLIAHACGWGRETGRIGLHLGAARSEGIYRFKRQFTRSGFYDYYVGCRIRMKSLYSEMVAMKGKGDGSYFPEYRG